MFGGKERDMSNFKTLKKDLENAGFINTGKIYHNAEAGTLIEESIKRHESRLLGSGALCVRTGKYTGRSPDDRFFAETQLVKDKIKWGTVNKPISAENYKTLYGRIAAYAENRDLFVFDGFIGADKETCLKVRVINQYAWQNLFVRQLFIRPDSAQLEDFSPDFTVISTPGLQAAPAIDGTNSEAAIIINFDEKTVLVAGTSYAGEMKKSCFTVMNFLLPDKGVLPMHCSANQGADGKTALFFGLSGTGKTTLSADPNRSLIGDDEHGWSDKGIFNFEGGCYAKCINLTREGEPQIWDAIRFGAVVENVTYDEKTLKPDYFDASITENSRVGYPLEHIPDTVKSGIGGHPEVIVFLTADAFGVMPPIAKLDINQACYYFMSGYTSKLAGTERGITEPQATFSACFGEPFLPRPVSVYTHMLKEKIAAHDSAVYLVNTGWTGGQYGVGKRIKLSYTRAMITAALNGDLNKAEYKKDDIFGLSVPLKCPGVPDEVLNVKNTWADKNAFENTAKDLAKSFNKNFQKYSGIEEAIAQAGPLVK
jgi:phosphoenolpyruvate carboxykinase (ATP)